MIAGSVLDQWEKSLNDGDLPNIVALYAKDAVLWGTFSKVTCDNPDLIKKYFAGLFQKTNLKVRFNSLTTRAYADVYVHSGTYEFSYVHAELITFPARFTFVVYKDAGGNYKIVEHHSSLIPN